jgi:plasmid stabilization system protein ParE
MVRYRFLPQAREELAAAVAFYDAALPGLGRDLAREARRLCGLIAGDPLAGPEVRPGIRRRLLRRFPYALLYGLDGDFIVILAVAHQRRRPGYWRERR